MGYHEGEEAFAALAAAKDAAVFGTELEVTSNGRVTMKIALPDSGSNAGTALAHLVAEMLGFTSRDRIRVKWGDTDLAPSSDEWFGGRTITLQGAATCSAADKLRKELLERASRLLKVDVTTATDAGWPHLLRRQCPTSDDVRRPGARERRPDPDGRPRRGGWRANRI